MKTRRFDLDFRPLKVHLTLDTVGSVPDRQTYRADLNEHTPDYTLTPLILQPILNIADDSMFEQPGRANARMANIKWFEVVAGVRKPIAAGTEYSIVTSGDDAGRLVVKKNVSPNEPVTVEFEAEYADSNRGEVFKLRASRLLRAKDATEEVIVDLDAPQQTLYNPLRNDPMQKISASVRVGERQAAPSEYTLRWEKKDNAAGWHAIGTSPLDYDVTVGAGHVIVDRSKMGEELYIRCTASYMGSGGTGRSVWDSPAEEVSIVRRIPAYDYDMQDVPNNIPVSMDRLNPRMVVKDAKGDIPNPGRELHTTWFVEEKKEGQPARFVEVAHGEQPTIPISSIDPSTGGMIAYDVKDRGPLAPAKDADGKHVKDADGAIILIH